MGSPRLKPSTSWGWEFVPAQFLVDGSDTAVDRGQEVCPRRAHLWRDNLWILFSQDF